MPKIKAIKSERHNCTIFSHEDNSILLLPTIFSSAMCLHQTAWVKRTVVDSDGFSLTVFKEEDISETLIVSIHNKLTNFLNWLGAYSSDSQYVNVDAHHNLPELLLNYYINEVLVSEQQCSEGSMNHYLMALRYYYDYLAMNSLTNAKNIRLTAKSKKEVRNNTKRRTAVKYLTPELRSLLYRQTDTLRDELLLRTGGELGLRSKENQGLLLDDFMVGNKRHKGFKSLFAQMVMEPNETVFTYHLQGKYTKAPRNSGGGKARTLYIHRSLLSKFKRYFDEERPTSSKNTLLVNNSYSHTGTPIAKSTASRVFTKIKKHVLAMQGNGEVGQFGQMLEVDHTHHILRHSFGTDKFHELCQKNRIAIDDVTPTSQVYLAVASLMGHSAKDKKAPKTTKTYIRSCQIKEMFEQGGHHD
tara:strand:+ start:137 stop:1378 length:1242 start_codon:yes stop_codon:yes gene_type:complete